MTFLDPENWRSVEELLDVVLELPLEERVPYLERVEDAELREKLLSILAADASAEAFLDEPLADYAAPLWDGTEEPQEDLAGSEVGPFRIEREIGRGGMGAVYLAERCDGAFDQQVALKLVLSNLVGGDVVDRFLQERQILARLQHPGIARLVDGGVTPDGQPYFAMELIEGEPITAHCDRLRLGIPDRLRLFHEVCEAVRYAHVHLVVHRDLKPSNVFVTTEGRVKLLDFGIAKLLDRDSEDGALTAAWGRMLTPERASPEQLRGEPITVATDVYQLGLLLYELLAGRQPFKFDETTPSSIERLICETDPPTASAIAARQPGAGAARAMSSAELSRGLRGDLDKILAKALRKEPERRYDGVASLLDDLDRYQKGLPVGARPDSFGYRTGKLIRRHPYRVVASATILVLLIAYAVTSTLQARRLAAEERRVRIEAEKTEQVKDFLVGLFEAADPFRTKRTETTAGELVEAGLRELDSGEVQDPATRAEMLGVLGYVLFRQASYERATEVLREALNLQRSIHGSTDHSDLALALERYADVVGERGQYAESEALIREALGMRRRLYGERHEAVATSLSALGAVLIYQGKRSEAEQSFRDALTIRRELPGAEDDPEVAELLNNLGVTLEKQRRLDEAAQFHRESLRMKRRLLDPEHPRIGESLNNLAVTQVKLGQFSEAEELYREALEVRRAALGDAHPKVANVLYNLAAVLFKTSRLEESIELHQQALTIRRATWGDRHPNVGLSLSNLSKPLLAVGRTDEAETSAREALTILRESLPEGHRLTSSPALFLGRLFLEDGRATEAEPLLSEALAIRLEDDEESVLTAEARLALGLCRASQGQLEDARTLLGAGLARLRGSDEGDRKLVAQAEAALQSLP